MQSRQVICTKVLIVAVAATSSAVSIAADADSLEELNRQIEVLSQKVLELDRKQQAAEREQTEAAKNVVTAGASKGSFKLPGSSTSVTLGGYVKLDAVFTTPSAGVASTADLFLQPNAIPVGPGAGDNERNQVKFGARESRVFAKTSTPTSWGDLVTYVEGDFYGADGNESVSNSNGLRLRHAYGSLGPLLGGQTWTNFMYVPSLPETVDFGGPVGQIFDRQAQIRWTQPFSAAGSHAGGRWSVALENPESVVTLAGGASFRADDDHFPDITGQVQFDTSKGRIAVAGLLRQVRADSTSPSVTDQPFGGALSVAGVVPTVGKDDVRFTVSAGNAIGRYSNGFFADGIVGSDGRIRLARQWLWYAAYRHFWTDALRSNVVLSSASASNPAGTPAGTNRDTQSAHVNLIWSPVANTDLGVEYILASRRTEDGQSGHLNRLQVAAKYSF